MNEQTADVLIVIVPLGFLWIVGWIATYFETSICQEPRLLKRAWLMLLSFFVWPCIALAMMRSRH